MNTQTLAPEKTYPIIPLTSPKDDAREFQLRAISWIENNLNPVDIRLDWQKEANYYYVRVATTKGSDLCILVNPNVAIAGNTDIFCRFESVDLVDWKDGNYDRISGKYNFTSDASCPEQVIEEFQSHLAPLFPQ